MKRALREDLSRLLSPLWRQGGAWLDSALVLGLWCGHWAEGWGIFKPDRRRGPSLRAPLPSRGNGWERQMAALWWIGCVLRLRDPDTHQTMEN